jgi:excisionase family DNA binding protein
VTRGKPHPQRPGDRRGGPKCPARASAPPGDHGTRGPTPRPGSLLLTIDEARERIGVARSTLYGLVQRGELLSVTIGRRRFIRATDLAAFVAALPASIPNGRDQ